MGHAFVDQLTTRSVHADHAANGAGRSPENPAPDRPLPRFTQREASFITQRDSFYLATVSPTGWPYIQHRGGPPGFLVVLDDAALAFADYRGNRQYITLGNVAGDDRAALFLIDYAQRRRLKVLAHMRAHDLTAEPDLAARLATPFYPATPERGFSLRLEAFDWNCPQHITPRFSLPEVEAATAPLRARLAVLEAENARLASLTTGLHRRGPSELDL